MGNATSYNDIWNLLKERNNRIRNYPIVIEKLVDEGLYFTSIPFIKEYLYKSSRPTAKLDKTIDEVISKVGIRQFELLPISTLKKSRGSTLKYVLAKRYFRKKRYLEVISLVNSIKDIQHPVAPFATLLKASTFSIQGKTVQALNAFRSCEKISSNFINKESDLDRLRQLEMTRDYCLLGVARDKFRHKEYETALSVFLDLSKDSPIWPEILFEEAWNSFYLRDYNRTLGKLVTYKAPLLNFAFNPENEVLKALTYLEMCLYSDSRLIIDQFYRTYESDNLSLGKILNKNKKNFKFYYLISKQRQFGEVRGPALFNRLLKMIINDPAYLEMYNSFQNARFELQKLKRIKNKTLKNVLLDVVKSGLILQRDLIGSYVRKILKEYYYQMRKSFSDLSYINLEVLSRRKVKLVGPGSYDFRSRGDVRNLKRTQKQYFWSFEGEFWLDELGDYVFSLKSECNK